MWNIVRFVLSMLLCTAFSLGVFTAPDPAAQGTKDQESTVQPEEITTATVVVDDHSLFEVAGTPDLTARQRAQAINTDLAELADSSEPLTVIVDGWFGDTSRMYVAGKLGRKAERLIQVTHDALFKGIEAAKPGNTFGDIGHAIQTYVESHRMSVVRDFCGHGLGRVFHAPPNVLHYGRSGTGPTLEEGMFFTIEPMVNLGRPETKVLADDWTAVTRDKSLSAQFEHSIGITSDGCKIFTKSPAGRFHPTYST